MSNAHEEIEAVEPTPAAGRHHRLGDADRKAFAENGRTGFGSPPKAARNDRVPEVDPAVLALTSDALAIAARADETETRLVEYQEAYADQLFDNAVNNIDQLDSGGAAAYAQQLAEGAGLDDYRTQRFVEEWGERDPHGAQLWLDAHMNNLSAAAAEERSREFNEQLTEEQARRAAAIDRFGKRHPDADDPTTLGLIAIGLEESISVDPSVLAPDRIEGVLDEIYRNTKQVERADRAEVGLHDFRSEFRREAAIQGGLFGTAATRDLQEGPDGLELRPEKRPAVPSLEGVNERLDRLPSNREQRAANVDEFRRSFADEASAHGGFQKGTWAEKNRAGAAAAHRARDDEQTVEPWGGPGR